MALFFNQKTQQWEDNENPEVNKYLAKDPVISRGATGSWADEPPAPAPVVQTPVKRKIAQIPMEETPVPMDAGFETPEVPAFPSDDALSIIKKQAEEKYKGRYSDIAIAQLFSNLGDAIGGRQVGSQNQVFQSLRDEAKGEKAQAEVDYKAKQDSDPNSAESKIAQSLAQQMGFKGDVSKLTAERWKAIGPVQAKMFELEAEKQKSRNDAEYKKGMLDIERQKLSVERGKSSLAKLNTTEKQVYNLANEGLKASTDMRNALANGDNTFSLVGDNNYTEAMRRFAENYGRLQSGGAINKDEEERFLKMAPGVTDSKEMQQRKLEKMEQMFRARLESLGIDSSKMNLTEEAPEAQQPAKPKWAR